MARPVTLFTGQWADLPLDDLPRRPRLGLRRPRARLLGRPFRGRPRARGRRLLPAAASCSSRTASAAGRSARISSGRRCATRSTSATAAILPPDVWGDGEPEGVRARAAERMKDTARAAARFGVTQVNGFTGSTIWQLLYSFPPNDFAEVERGVRGVRGALGADPRRVRRGGRALRAGGAPDRDRVRLRHHAQGARRARPARGVRDQPRPEPLRAAVPRPGRVRAASSPTASTTST